MGLDSILCQYQQQQQSYSNPTHYTIQHHHQPSSSHPQPQSFSQSSQFHQDFQPSTAPFDFEKFNQQAKQLQAQLQFFNQQQQKHIQQQINSVHQEGSEPQFDFAVNGNYSDLEKASEQFVNLGRLVGKQNIAPKVIKITKTVAVKQPVPVPYPVPIVKVVKEQVPIETTHYGYNHYPSSTPKPSDFKPSMFFNYTSYINKHPSLSLIHI